MFLHPNGTDSNACTNNNFHVNVTNTKATCAGGAEIVNNRQLQAALTCFVSVMSVASMLACVLSFLSITSKTSESFTPSTERYKTTQYQHQHNNRDGLRNF